MKWNWGTKLVVAMAAFMIMIITFAVLMMREDVDLVEKDYYPKGQAFQEMIEKKTNAAPYNDSVTAVLNNSTIVLVFPASFQPSGISGTLHLYDRMREAGDQQFELRAGSDGIFSFSTGDSKGRFILKIDWQYNDKQYYTEKSLDIP